MDVNARLEPDYAHMQTANNLYFVKLRQFVYALILLPVCVCVYVCVCACVCVSDLYSDH